MTGGILDSLKVWIALAVIRHRFGDQTLRSYADARIAAIVAAVPAAADFDMSTLAELRVPLALITAHQDRWLAPRFHGERVLQVCKSCIRLVYLPAGGHGALLSPMPPGLSGVVADLLNDPPGFDRAAATEEVDRKVTAFFASHLLPSTDGQMP